VLLFWEYEIKIENGIEFYDIANNAKKFIGCF